MRGELLVRLLGAAAGRQADLHHHQHVAEARDRADEVADDVLLELVAHVLRQGRVLDLGVVLVHRQAGRDHLLDQVDGVEDVDRVLAVHRPAQQVGGLDERADDPALHRFALDAAVGQRHGAALVRSELERRDEALGDLDLRRLREHRLEGRIHASRAELIQDRGRLVRLQPPLVHGALERRFGRLDVDDVERLTAFDVDAAVGNAQSVEELVLLPGNEHGGSLRANTHTTLVCPPSVLLI